MPDNKREEARLKEIAFQDWKGLSPKANTRTLWQHRQEKAFGAGYDAGKRAGAASIDRVQVVREAFEEVKDYLKSQWLFDSEFAQSTYKAGDREQVGWNGGIEKAFETMDAVIAEMEVKNDL